MLTSLADCFWVVLPAPGSTLKNSYGRVLAMGVILDCRKSTGPVINRRKRNRNIFKKQNQPDESVPPFGSCHGLPLHLLSMLPGDYPVVTLRRVMNTVQAP